jgi:hypothetical protein
VSPRPIFILLLGLIVALTIFVAAVVIWSLYNRTSAPGVPNTPWFNRMLTPASRRFAQHLSMQASSLLVTRRNERANWLL